MKKQIQLTDDQLVKLYATGDNKAFETLLFRHKDKVYTYIYLILHHRELTEDIFQETFIKAITSIRQGRYVESGKFLPWVNRIAYNLIIDYFRKEKRENIVSNDDNDNYDLFSSSTLTEKSIEDIVIHEQVLCDIVHLMDFLPEKQQKVIRMRFFEELSFQEIAEATGVSVNTALGRMRYALINMRKLALDHNLSLEVK